MKPLFQWCPKTRVHLAWKCGWCRGRWEGCGVRVRGACKRCGVRVRGAYEGCGVRVRGAFEGCGVRVRGACERCGARVRGAGAGCVWRVRVVGAGCGFMVRVVGAGSGWWCVTCAGWWCTTCGCRAARGDGAWCGCGVPVKGAGCGVTVMVYMMWMRSAWQGMSRVEGALCRGDSTQWGLMVDDTGAARRYGLERTWAGRECREDGERKWLLRLPEGGYGAGMCRVESGRSTGMVRVWVLRG